MTTTFQRQSHEKLDSRFIRFMAFQSLLKNCIDCIVFPYVVCDRKDAGMTQSTDEWLTPIGDVKACIICIDYTRQEPKKGEVVQIVSWRFRSLAGCFV